MVKKLISLIIAAGMVVTAGKGLSSAGSGKASIIVHCYNPEGVEINSIEEVGDCPAVIYDGEEFLSYGAKDMQTYGKPVTLPAGAHKIKAIFNGMELSKNINLAENQTQELAFIFERVEQHTKIKNIFDSQGVDSIYADISYPIDGYEKDWEGRFMRICLFRESNAMYFKIKAEASLSSSLFRIEGFVEDIYPQWDKMYSAALSMWRVDYNNIIEGTTDFTNWFHQGYYGGDKKRCSSIYIKTASGEDIDLTPAYNENPVYFLKTTDASQSYNSVYGYPRFPDALELYSSYPYYRFLVSGYLYTGDYYELSAPIELDLNFNTMKIASVPYDLQGTGVGAERPAASIKSIIPSPAKPGETVSMQGEGSDKNAKITAYRWRSSKDGELSTQSAFNTAELSEGRHKIYFKVQNELGIWSEEASKSIYIGISGSSADSTHGETKNEENSEGEPVNIVTGNMYTIEEDISVPAGIGLGLDYSRCYNSHKVYQGPLGYGWTHSYNIILEEIEEDGQVRIMGGDGRAIYFSKKEDQTYSPQAGEHSSLSKEEEGYIWRQKNGIKYYFGPQGKLMTIADRNNNLFSLSYNIEGRLETVTDSPGREINFEYNAEKLISRVTGPAGNSVQYSYDTKGNLTKATDLRGKETVYEYNSEHNIEKITDAKGSILHFEYDNQDRCIANYRDNDILRINLNYDPAGQKTTIKDSLGRERTKSYNQEGLITQIEEADGKSIYYSWDADENRTSLKDKNGSLTQMSYDEKGNLLSVTDAQENTTRYEYEPEYNFISKTIDTQGNSTTYSYDSNGNQTSITDALGNQTTWTYDSQGLVYFVEDANGSATNYGYDSYGNVNMVLDAAGNQTLSSYDITGNRISMTDARGSTTSYEYDPAGNLTGITYPDTTEVKISYDDNGNRVSISDANGNTSRYEYSATGKISKSIDALGRQVAYNYDTEENLIEVIDAKDNSTKYSYDELNRLAREENAIGIAMTYEYDASGNKIAGIDGKKQVIRYEYDNLNRMIKKIYPDDREINYEYDSLCRIVKIEDKTEKIKYTYDQIGRITKVERENKEDGKQDKVEYEYDAVGNRIRMADQDGMITEYKYTKLNQLETISTPEKDPASFRYDETGNIDAIDYFNGIRINYDFDKMDRLEKVENKDSSGRTLSSYSYTYDAAGRRTQAVFSRQAVELVPEGETSQAGEIFNGEIHYIYDAANQLIEEQSYAQGNNYTISYEYDKAGNRIKMIKNGQASDYKYNAANQLIEQTSADYSGGNKVLVTGETGEGYYSSIIINGIPVEVNGGKFSVKVAMMPGENLIRAQAYDQAGNFSEITRKVNLNTEIETAYSYDNNGNRIQKSYRGEQSVYNYDFDNQLREIIHPGGSSTRYTYDTQGRRISEEKSANDAVKRTDYLYDGSSVIIERDETGKTTAGYIRGISMGGGIGSLISAEKEGEEYYYLYDGQGNVIQLTDRAGKVIISYEYDAFGNITRRQGSLENAPGYLFQTKEADEESGLIYFGARYYDPQLGRWLTPDPMGMIDGPNTYLYCSNNPVGFIDPWGLCKKDSWLDWLQGVLDAGGVFEPTPFCDLGSSIISAFRGKWGDAACSVAATIPYIGDVVGKGGKYGGKVTKQVTVIGHLPEYIDVAKKMGAKYFKAISNWSWRKQGKFIKNVIKNGDDVYIGTLIREGKSVLKKEIKQLIKAGYRPVKTGSKWLIKGY